MADWSQLPYDIIEMIAVQLDAVEDFLAFSAVCRSWRSIYLTKKWTPGPQVPWLMLSDNENSNVRGFFSLYRDKVYELELPETRGRRCWGSSDGWLVTIGSDQEIHLLNAFTRFCRRLPGPCTFQIHNDTAIDWYRFIDKAIVIRKPTFPTGDQDELLVMAIYGPFKQLAFTRPGFSSWINVEESFQHWFMDVTFVNDQIFTLSDARTLLLVDTNSQLREVAHFVPPPDQWACKRIYLVESQGDLWMVYQYLFFWHGHPPPIKPTQFQVFKFDFGAREWTELRDLGDRALFVGDSVAFTVRAASSINCKCNSIYFVGSRAEDWGRFDDHVYRDSGVYNMADGTVEPFYFGADYPSYYSCPIWLAPILVYAAGD